MRIIQCPRCKKWFDFSLKVTDLSTDGEYTCRPCGCIYLRCETHGNYAAPRPCPMPPPGHKED